MKITLSTFLSAVICFLAQLGYARIHDAVEMLRLDTRLAAKEIDEAEYLAAADEWLNQQFADGIHFERDSLVKLMGGWKAIAWSADSLIGYRINYFVLLSNNANYANREGESVYFLEKAEQEILNAYGEKPLMVAGRKCNTYIDKRHYSNVIATYEKERAYIARFPELIKSKGVNLNIAASFINVLNPVINAYANLRDTNNVDETLALAEAIHTELMARIPSDNNTAFTVNFYVQQLHYYKHFTLDGNRSKSHDALLAMKTALYADTTRPKSLIGQLEPVLITRLTEYFLKYGQNDSAAHYLARLKAMPGVFTDHDFTLNLFESELLANRGAYRDAYERARAGMFAIDSIQSILVDDIDDLLYASTDAELSRAAWAEAERVKTQRMVWLIVVIGLAAAAVTAIYITMIRKNRKSRALIDKLNDAANNQVAAMEGITNQAVRQEQERLARDLHDSLSSTLAGIKHQIDLLAIDHPTSAMAPKLAEIGGYMEEAYAIARGKSHQWFADAATRKETSFEKRVQMILDTALPDDKYTKTIDIDDDTLNGIATETRVELLRIIQEAVTNTIKHARARMVSVLLYREEQHLLLAVADDGKTTAKRGLTGMGTRSMQERVSRLGGFLKIQSTETGTEVLATIPIP